QAAVGVPIGFHVELFGDFEFLPIVGKVFDLRNRFLQRVDDFGHAGGNLQNACLAEQAYATGGDVEEEQRGGCPAREHPPRGVPGGALAGGGEPLRGGGPGVRTGGFGRGAEERLVGRQRQVFARVGH